MFHVPNLVKKIKNGCTPSANVLPGKEWGKLLKWTAGDIQGCRFSAEFPSTLKTVADRGDAVVTLLFFELDIF